MAVTTQVRFLTDIAQGTPTPTDMLLPVFGGEILAAYDEFNLFEGMVRTRTIESGISAEFPNLWKIGSEIHEAGEELLGSNVDTMKTVINLDSRPRVASFEVDDIDTILSHFDPRSELARELGKELSRQIDRNIAKMLVLASRTTATSPFPGGGIDQNGTAEIDAALANDNAAGAQALLDSIVNVVVQWDENDVPDNDRFCVVRPGLWYEVRKLGTLVTGVSAEARPLIGNREIDSANPQIHQGTPKTQYLEHCGVKIYRSNHLPTTNTTATDLPNYAGNFTNTKGIVFQRDAVAFLRKLGITTEMERDVRRQADFMVAKTLTGGGALRPLAAVELASA